MRPFVRMLWCFCCLTGLVFAGSAQAQLSKAPVSYASVGEPLFIATRTLEKTLGVKIVLKELSGDQEIKGSYIGANAEAFLDDFTRKNNMVWRFSGGQLFLAKQGVDLVGATATQSNPSNFTKIVHDPKNPDKLGLMIFQVHNSWVDDKRYSINNENRVISGVATLFRQFTGMSAMGTGANQPPNAPQTTKTEREPALTASAKNQNTLFGLFSGANPPAAWQNDAAPNGANSELLVNTRGVYADARLNALLVRDKVSLFDTYKGIVNLLDRPVEMVQMDAYIVDVRKSKATEYGLDLSLSEGSAASRAILGGISGKQLLSTLRAMEAKNDSQFLSIPSVVAMNNMEATFSARENLFIQVKSERDAALHRVTAETRLSVTPLIANENDQIPYSQRRIRLFVNVQDATVTTAQRNASDSPSTSENQINTQAVVRSGDTLMLGGQIIRKRTDASTGIPILASIPGLGFLFSVKEGSYDEFIRIYVVKPTILGEDSNSASQVEEPIALPAKPKVVIEQ